MKWRTHDSLEDRGLRQKGQHRPAARCAGSKRKRPAITYSVISSEAVHRRLSSSQALAVVMVPPNESTTRISPGAAGTARGTRPARAAWWRRAPGGRPPLRASASGAGRHTSARWSERVWGYDPASGWRERPGGCPQNGSALPPALLASPHGRSPLSCEWWHEPQRVAPSSVENQSITAFGGALVGPILFRSDMRHVPRSPGTRSSARPSP